MNNIQGRSEIIKACRHTVNVNSGNISENRYKYRTILPFVVTWQLGNYIHKSYNHTSY